MSLRVKVLLILILLCLGGGYWSYRWVYHNIRPQFLRIMEDDMVDQAFLLARLVESQMPDKVTPKSLGKLPLGKLIQRASQQRIQARIYEWEKRKTNFRVYITDTKGIVRLDSDNGRDIGQDYSRWNDVYLALRGHYGARSSRERNSKGQIVNALYVAFPMYKQGKLVGVLTLAKSKASLVGWAERAQQKLWQGVLVGASVLFLVALLATQAVLQPIFRLTQYARNVAAGRRVPPPRIGHDEIGVLTQSFLEMKDALWKRQDIESFVTQLTHELKSPISAIQGAAELLEDPEMPEPSRIHFLQNIQHQTGRMNDIVNRLLLLVSLEQQEALESHDEIDLTQLLDELKQRFLSQATQKQITLHTEITPHNPPTLHGDRFLLEQALTNLLQNSLNFTPKDGEITLRISHTPDKIEFFVTDTGPGIPEYALPRVLERFYSLEHPDTDQKGTGLGLPFVQQVALLHGGDFSIQNRKPHGTNAQLWLPTSA